MLVVLVLLLVAACASAPPSPQSRTLFNDHLFGAPSERIDASDVFALSAAMRKFVAVEIANRLHVGGRREGLVDALRSKAGLQLEYDAAITRNAARGLRGARRQLPVAGDHDGRVRQGARPAGPLPERVVDDTWSRTGDIYFSIGHVNLALGTPGDRRSGSGATTRA